MSTRFSRQFFFFIPEIHYEQADLFHYMVHMFTAGCGTHCRLCLKCIPIPPSLTDWLNTQRWISFAPTALWGDRPSLVLCKGKGCVASQRKRERERERETMQNESVRQPRRNVSKRDERESKGHVGAVRGERPCERAQRAQGAVIDNNTKAPSE